MDSEIEAEEKNEFMTTFFQCYASDFREGEKSVFYDFFFQIGGGVVALIFPKHA